MARVRRVEEAKAGTRRICPGCRSLDGEHDFGEGCTLSEDGAEPGFRPPREVPVEGARRFVTLGPDWPGWRDDEAEFPPEVEGAFVRVEPPPEASEATVEHVRSLAGKLAVRVSVAPRRRAPAVLAPREKRPHLKAREVVEGLVAEHPREADRPALSQLCEELMAKRGL